MNGSPTTDPPSGTATVWKQRYEALRQLAIGGRQILEGDPLGLVLVVRQGIVGWMRSWAELAPTALPERAPIGQSPVVPTSALQQQLTEVLTQMSLAHL